MRRGEPFAINSRIIVTLENRAKTDIPDVIVPGCEIANPRICSHAIESGDLRPKTGGRVRPVVSNVEISSSVGSKVVGARLAHKATHMRAKLPGPNERPLGVVFGDVEQTITQGDAAKIHRRNGAELAGERKGSGKIYIPCGITLRETGQGAE